jgi:hypothetical protein
VPRHRRSPSSARSWRLLGIRVAALLTLAAGLTGGLFLDDDDSDQAKQAAANAAAYEEGERIEQELIRNRHAQAVRDEAIERARLKAEAEAEAARKRAAAEAARKNRPPSRPYTGPIPTSCKVYSGNRAIGCALMLEAGHPIAEFPCLEKLWTKESGWTTTSSSPSGAYGIPQALPGSKMAIYGDDWQTNPATQIKWGLNYIKSRYSTPCGAWQHFLDTGWY